MHALFIWVHLTVVKSLRHASRVIVALALSKGAVGISTANAAEASVGFAAVEEGDERIRPGLALHLGWSEFYTSRLHYYGREFGPVREQTWLVSFNRRWGIFKSNTTTASIGLAAMDEHIRIHYAAAEDAAFNEDEHNYNAGLAFGVAWSLPKSAAPLNLSVSWDSYLFPAGLNGLIFLSTGRKQTISVTMGVML